MEPGISASRGRSSMRILWVTNVGLPEAYMLMGEHPSHFGGWLVNSAFCLANIESVELFVSFPTNKANKYKQLVGKKVKYYPFAPIKDNDTKRIKNNEYFDNLLAELQPDIVHIHGTEMAHALSMVNACKRTNTKVVISIQGLVSVIEKHMYSNLPTHVIYGKSLRNIIRGDNVEGLRRRFIRKGNNEIEALRKVDHIIGRTTWDKACSQQINPKAKYYSCNETLRDVFYRYQWKLEYCERHSIFTSQGQYSIKGLHFMLEAMPLILQKFPDAKLFVAGKNIISSQSLKERLLMTYYGKYLKKIIINLRLEKHVIFTGLLSESEMCQRYIRSHVFVCPSSIENSPNSLGESMILGVPSVASFVGGIPDMLKDKEDGFLYQHDAPYMLAYYVCKIFEDDDLALKFSTNARKRALRTHDISQNTKRLMDIYDEIILQT